MSQQQMEKTTQRREDEQPQEMPTVDEQASQNMKDALDAMDEYIDEELSINEDIMGSLTEAQQNTPPIFNLCGCK